MSIYTGIGIILSEEIQLYAWNWPFSKKLHKHFGVSWMMISEGFGVQMMPRRPAG